ncbi:MAG: hypothetical protein R3C40_09455 [Parvularculaceae bacterium]
MANTGRFNFDQHFPHSGTFQLDFIDFEWRVRRDGYGRSGFHLWLSVTSDDKIDHKLESLIGEFSGQKTTCPVNLPAFLVILLMLNFFTLVPEENA